jgi:hypothetical protein
MANCDADVKWFSEDENEPPPPQSCGERLTFVFVSTIH